MKYRILEIDKMLKPYEKDINLRMDNYKRTKKALLAKGQTLSDFANGYLYFGIHRTESGWCYREWAPGAEAMYFTGDFNGWDRHATPMEKKENGVFEVNLPDVLRDGQKVMAIVVHEGKELDRIPLYATYVVQNPKTIQWDAQLYLPAEPFRWTDQGFKPAKNLYIYECHIGMAQETPGVGTYRQFRENVLPRIKALGYNTIQVMAVMEHPYYASFGYQVTNFFAASSRFGTPDELKELVNAAHELGIAVLLDVVHSHAAKNAREGINLFDGTDYQFFHAGPRGEHPAWNTKCFNYGKNEVLHFLLSNLKFWQTEYHFDGFRFDGVTSMLYRNHGLGESFGDYKMYFSLNTDTEAVTYLQLANELVRQVNPNAITIAEDTSAMPGLCLPISAGGIGFDYRLAMGIPDMWIKLLKEVPDEHWDMWKIWSELTGRRPKEPVIGYAESHDQALVGDKTIMFRLCDKEMYWGMEKTKENMVIDRGMALHKMIRLVTMSLGGEGYLNFMGNEFGHPEWIDFPREGNGWSYQYCRRQWSLPDNPNLKYSFLNEFDKAMVALSQKYKLLAGESYNLWTSQKDKLLAYTRKHLVFAFNFHPTKSQDGFFLPVQEAGLYQVILSTDEPRFGGQDRISTTQLYEARREPNGQLGFRIYLPSRCAMVLKLKKKKK
ncbi:MAG: alpha-amylase family glycosyl hydrolase [Candidatus Faecousia sp.]|nr:alpha-amylase family glycosyl hydrolase [Bacillota bacterium]MDY4220797.1 alpha-amylase family glycosyl hydrolase [Candidatus Faecousia sp.]